MPKFTFNVNEIYAFETTVEADTEQQAQEELTEYFANDDGWDTDTITQTQVPELSYAFVLKRIYH